MIQEVSSMTTVQSFIGVASSSNIKCSFCLCEECEQQHDYFISRVKELTDIFKEMTYNIDVHTSKKISQPLKCRRRDKDDHYLANCSNLEFKQLDFVVASPKKKDWFYVMSQPKRCWTDEVNPCPLLCFD
ncbi:hypothetical protein R3W88_034232 [Solanum pinnatisectum]|uniref:Uncharacterized protein n=1 Tax=Solanum pinnatisectum TaxID=50273 RepID=A0AAV9JYQ6_9SOLN|nr:hypothetical protein R3W88_034232 [Solanum pinnatisectum]